MWTEWRVLLRELLHILLQVSYDVQIIDNYLDIKNGIKRKISYYIIFCLRIYFNSVIKQCISVHFVPPFARYSVVKKHRNPFQSLLNFYLSWCTPCNLYFHFYNSIFCSFYRYAYLGMYWHFHSELSAQVSSGFTYRLDRLKPTASRFRGPPVKVYNIFNTVIGLSHLCCHNVLYFLNNPSGIFLT